TSAVGAASRTTVNVDVEPASVVRRFPEPSVVPVWTMVTPFSSTSATVELLVTALLEMEMASLPELS
ncbi:hypothetical protein OAD91_01710, partial [Synechococcus sp. AH-551-E19]|nr:hypothetical protein [Synechococcus sp. AH-551-E19]